MSVAFVCRYGNQDFFRFTGRDPARRPMTLPELQLFERAIYEHLCAEREPRATTAGSPR